MKIAEYLSKKRVATINAKNKEEAITLALSLFEGSPAILDHGAFSDAIWERERVLSTGVGLGIGVPHVRTASVRHPASALVVLKEGVDYGSMDGIPVNIILVIAMPENTHGDYLAYLAKASRLFQKPDFRNKLLTCETPDDIWETIKDE